MIAFFHLNDTSILWPTVEAVVKDFVDLGATAVRTSTLLLLPLQAWLVLASHPCGKSRITS
jgi:hypothetical protein